MIARLNINPSNVTLHFKNRLSHLLRRMHWVGYLIACVQCYAV